jgi:hypothetical protein
MASAVSFQVVTEADPPAAQIRIRVDGIDLVDLVGGYERERGFDPTGGYGGLIPSWYGFGPMSDHFLGLSPTSNGGLPELVPLLGCNCGEWGCWPMLARIVATDEQVQWLDFAQPHRREWDYSGFGPFTFVRAGYDDALADLERQIRDSSSR